MFTKWPAGVGGWGGGPLLLCCCLQVVMTLADGWIHVCTENQTSLAVQTGNPILKRKKKNPGSTVGRKWKSQARKPTDGLRGGRGWQACGNGGCLASRLVLARAEASSEMLTSSAPRLETLKGAAGVSKVCPPMFQGVLALSCPIPNTMPQPPVEFGGRA